MEDQVCERADLLAVVPRWDRWAVDKDGNTTTLDQEGEVKAVREDIEEYVCENCGEFFTSDKRFDMTALELAWQAALDHLHPKKAV